MQYEPTSGSFKAADRDGLALERRGVAIRLPDWQIAGEVKADGGLSLADTFGVALAHELDDTLVVGRDDDFGDLPVDVTIGRIGGE